MVLSANGKICVVGLGYVGLPIALEFANHFETVGYDISKQKITQLRSGVDLNGEIAEAVFYEKRRISFSYDPQCMSDADLIVVTVPTPIDEEKQPDLGPLAGACETIGRYIKKNCIVVFESTVFPGATEEFCVPIIERHSSFIWKKDFFVGYSPERINPGDKENNISNVIKLVSADSEKTLEIISEYYSKVVVAGLKPVNSIKAAEASKLLENIQRDVNISLINELALLFDKLDLNTQEILDAASTKWNFAYFTPGLVGGHCISVDPYYLLSKADAVDYDCKLIKMSRTINEEMPREIARRVIATLDEKDVEDANIIVYGLAFKENTNDIRNSKVLDLIDYLTEKIAKITVIDPLVIAESVPKSLKVNLSTWERAEPANVLIITNNSFELSNLSEQEILSKIKPNGAIFDIKSCLKNKQFNEDEITIWTL